MAEVPILKLVHPAPESDRRSTSSAAHARSRRIISIGGGKGGIGKSLITGNIGIHLARLKKKVLLVDADLGGANLHTCLGVDLPRISPDGRRLASLRS